MKTLGAIHTAPPHIRTHFLLNTGDGTPGLKWGSTNVYTQDAAGNPVYSWTLMDGIMDTITGSRAFPFAEIAFMPHDLSVHPDPYTNSSVRALDGGAFYPPKDYAKWGALIAAWAAHSGTRYNGAASWQWELWNEPDLSYWHGTPAEYIQLYDYTEAALHGALPNTPLGGPAVAVPSAPLLAQFLQHCATGTNAVSGKTGTKLDMVTFHAKGGVAIVGGHVEMNLGHQLQLHRTAFSTVASFPQFKQTPIVVTEADPDGCAACPASQTPADAYRNSPAYGAYEVAMMKHTLELESQLGVNVRGLVTWAFLFENQPYFLGYRVLQSNGLHLPVLNAFKLLGSLDGARLPVTSSGALTANAIMASSVRGQPEVDAMATLNGQQVQVIVWNYHDDLVAAAPSPVHLTVQLPASFGARATVSHLRVDDTHGDPYTVWVSQGSPAAPSATQLAQLQAAADAITLQPPQAIDVVANTATVDFSLPRFGVSLVTLSPVGLLDGSAGDSSLSMASSGVASGGSGANGSSGGGAGPDADTSAGSGAAASGAGGNGGSGSGSGGSAASGSASNGSGANGSGGGNGSSGGNGSGANGSGSGGCSCRLAGLSSAAPMSLPAGAACIALPIAVAFRRRRSTRRAAQTRA